MGDGGGARTSRASVRFGGGGHVRWEEGSRGLLAAYLSIVAIFFLKPHREYTARAQVPLKKEKPEH